MNLNINNDLSVEQKAFVDSARKFSKDNIAEKALEWDKNSFFPIPYTRPGRTRPDRIPEPDSGTGFRIIPINRLKYY